LSQDFSAGAGKIFITQEKGDIKMDIMGIIATVVTVALGVSLVWTKAEKILIALKEVADILTSLASALSDKTLTTEEIAQIKKEVSEAVAALKAIIGK
jgi:hypothetical protein